MLKQNEEMTDCPICCEEFTIKARAPIKCGHCDFTSCKQCVRKFAINPDTFNEPHCMSCNGKWDRSFFKKAVNTSWFNGNHGYKQHMKNGLFHLEKARFPETMEAVSNYVKVPQFRQDNRNMEKEVTEMQKKLSQLKRHIRINKQNIERFTMGLPAINIETKKKDKKVFIHRCPAAECLGFLSSAWKCGICNVWACSNCGEIKGHTSDTVSKEQLDELHVCKPENIESMNMIKKETRPCPDCAVPIFKISGCDQMWCTQCHIAFSWNTGRKVTGIVHNPHFYAWARENNTNARRVVGEVACGGIPGRGEFVGMVRAFVDTLMVWEVSASNNGRHYLNNIQHQQIKSIFNYSDFTSKHKITLCDLKNISSSTCRSCEETKERVQKRVNNVWYLLFLDFLLNSDDYHRRLTHFRAVELDTLRQENQNQTDNKMLRIQYLSKEITQKVFETKLLSHDKKKRKKIALLELFELVNTVFTETFIDIINKMRMILPIFNKWKIKDDYEENLLGIMDNFKRIVRITCYANKQLRKISHEFNLCVPHICFDLSMYRGSYKYFREVDYVEPNVNASMEESNKLKNLLALKQMQSVLNNKDIVSDPLRYFKRINKVLITVYGGNNKSHFNINTPIHTYVYLKQNGSYLKNNNQKYMKKDTIKAPIPIIVLNLLKNYFMIKLSPMIKVSPNEYNMSKIKISDNGFTDDSFYPWNCVGDERRAYTKYKNAISCMKSFMEIVNSKKMPYNRNIQCSKGKTIKWYEETTLPMLINNE